MSESVITVPGVGDEGKDSRGEESEEVVGGVASLRAF